MGEAKKPVEAKLFLGIMYSDKTLFQQAIDRCIAQYGPLGDSYGPLNLSSFTDYYHDEMGDQILKSYHIFEKPILQENLSDIKTFTNSLESEFAFQGNRRVNLDPGILNKDKLILATTKDFFHRIYLRDGIYAEVTLHFRHGQYRHFSWTYPDYKNEEVQRFLMKTRSILVRDQRREVVSSDPAKLDT